MNIFQHVKMSRPGRNKFDLSHEKKMSMQMGDLIPMLVQEVVPGDSFRVKTELMLRMAPMLAPIMHRINITTHYFFVPNRLVWDEWEDFITGGREGTSEPVVPHFMSNNVNANPFLQAKGGLSDFLGLPLVPSTTVGAPISSLPFRAYQLIWDEYYRDQNLQQPLDIKKDSGLETGAVELEKILTLRKRAWEKDYFTSALPWSQRGGDVSVPLGGTADVIYKDISEIYDSAGDPPSSAGALWTDPVSGEQMMVSSGTGTNFGRVENIESVDLDSATGVSINELRRSIKLQEWLEKNARGGARYVEQILSHFGVRSSDARLQRPEYLGGARNPMVISEVLSTYQDPDQEGSPQANMAGHGVSFGRQNGFRRNFEEHGYIIGIMSVLPKTAYQQGVPRHFSRANKLDYYWPEFANIGEQEILNKELYFTGETPDEPYDATFGYTPRYAEYKYQPSTVHGEMRDELAYWHMGRIFENQPQLNAEFITSNPTTRIFPVQDEGQTDTMYCQLYNKIDAIRPMPYFGTPTL